MNNVFVINLHKRKDRLELFRQQAQKHGIAFHVFSAVYLGEGKTNGINGATKSHLAIAKMSRDRELDMVTVFEDDAQFTDDYEQTILNNDLIIDKITDIDMLYFGASYTERFLWQKDGIVRSAGANCLHAYNLYSRFYDKFIATLEAALKNSIPCDTAISAIHKDNNVYGYFPSIVKQRPSYSDIEGRDVDYTNTIK